jgi:hypothetical protein
MPMKDVPESIKWIFSDPDIIFHAEYNGFVPERGYNWTCVIIHQRPEIKNFYCDWFAVIKSLEPTFQALVECVFQDIRASDDPSEFSGDVLMLIQKTKKNFFRFIQQCITAHMCMFLEDQ